MFDKIDVIIQARIDSTRLPGKVVMPIGNNTLIGHIIERVSLSKHIRNIIIATTEDSLSEIQRVLSKYDFVQYFVGSKENVLERYFMAAKKFDSKIIVRATGDNPLVDPEFLDKAIEIHISNNADLTHFLGIPLGTGVEVISREALALSYKNTKSSYDKEHVTPFIYKNRDSFKVLEPLSKGIYYAPDIRVTVDTKEDLEKVRKIFSYYNNKKLITIEDIVNYYKIKENVKTFVNTASYVTLCY